MKRTKSKPANKPWNPQTPYPLSLTLTGYTTPSLNTMLGRNHWILTKLKKEAREALVSALQSPATALALSTSTTEPVAANPS